MSKILKAYYRQDKYSYLTRLLYDMSCPISDNFVNLAIIKDTERKETENQISQEQFEDRRIYSFEDIHKPKEPIQLETIFEKQLQDKVISKRIIIEGRAGM